MVDTIKICLHNLLDTERLGRLLGETAAPGETICLDGDLGTGKTTLTQAIARGLAVPVHCYVTSPSFAIVHEYEGRLPMYHMDFYRLQGDNDIVDQGLEEYFYLAGLTVIEWSIRATSILPADRLSLEISLNDDLTRTVVIRATGLYRQRLQRILELFVTPPASGSAPENSIL